MALVLETATLDYFSGEPSIPSRDEKISLLSVLVSGDLIDFVGKISITQTYRNDYPHPIEAKYFFNLDSNSTVTGMRMIIGSRVLVSEIKEKSEARETYEKAIEEKKRTCLLERGGNGIHTMNVGNIGEGEEIRIQFDYVTQLVCSESGEMKFLLPTNISPPYQDTSHETVKDILDNQATTSQLTFSSSQSLFAFDLQLHWKSNNKILEVKSLTNEIEVTPDNNQNPTDLHSVTIRSKTAPHHGDFNVLVSTDLQPTIYVHSEAEDTFVMLNHCIKEEYAEENGADEGLVEGDYTIIVDRSGSMDDPFGGWSGGFGGGEKTKMDYAREACRLFVQSLPFGSTFNVISFGSNYEPMFSGSAEYTEETKDYALKQIETFQANMGGTELYNCLSDVVNQGLKKGGGGIRGFISRIFRPGESEPSSSSSSHVKRDRIVLLMTDGDVGNIDSLEKLLTPHRNDCRVFTIGIGKDVNRALCERLAKASNAYSEILVDNPDIATLVAKMMDASSMSYYRNVTVKFTPTEILNLPEKTIYPKQYSAFYYKIPTKEFLKNCKEIILSSDNGKTGKRVEWKFPINHAEDNSQENKNIPQLYAMDLVRQLQKAESQKTAEIIKLSVRYQIMNEYTSFVVVDEILEPGKDGMVTIHVPQYTAAKYDEAAPAAFASSSISRGFGGARRLCSAAPPCPPPPGSADLFGFALGGMPPSPPAAAPMMFDMAFTAAAAAPAMYFDDENCKTNNNNNNNYDNFTYNNGDLFESTAEGCCDEEEADNSDDEVLCAKSCVSLASAPEKEEEVMLEKKSEKKKEAKGAFQTFSEKADKILQFKKVDGSFTLNPQIFQILEWSESSISQFASSFTISEIHALNLWIYKFLKQVVENPQKYVMITRNLEKWLKKDLLTNTNNPKKLSLDEFVANIQFA